VQIAQKDTPRLLPKEFQGFPSIEKRVAQRRLSLQ
jgi:hypothetical protein